MDNTHYLEGVEVEEKEEEEKEVEVQMEGEVEQEALLGSLYLMKKPIQP